MHSRRRSATDHDKSGEYAWFPFQSPLRRPFWLPVATPVAALPRCRPSDGSGAAPLRRPQLRCCRPVAAAPPPLRPFTRRRTPTRRFVPLPHPVLPGLRSRATKTDWEPRVTQNGTRSEKRDEGGHWLEGRGAPTCPVARFLTDDEVRLVDFMVGKLNKPDCGSPLRRTDDVFSGHEAMGHRRAGALRL